MDVVVVITPNHKVTTIWILQHYSVVLIVRLALASSVTFDDYTNELISRVLALKDIVLGLGVDI